MSCPKILSRCRVIALAAIAALAIAPAVAGAESVPAAFPAPDLSPPVPSPPVPREITSSGSVTVTADFVIILYTEGDIGTIFLGNSSIANATMTDGQMIVLRGVTQGVTNMIVLDTAGEKMADYVVQVSDRNRGTVTVRRAMVMQSYACLVGICESTGASGAAPLVETASAAGPK